MNSVAVVVIHAYRASGARARARRAGAEAGFAHVALLATRSRASSACSRAARPTVLDAYLTPLLRELRRVLLGRAARQRAAHHAVERRAHRRRALPRARTRSCRARPAASSRCARVAERAGLHAAIGFDMGGTSTDVSRFDGELERVYETEVAGVRVRAPMLRDPHGRGGRRLAVPLRRLPLHRRARERGRRAGAALLRATRTRASSTLTDVNLRARPPAARSLPVPARRDAPVERRARQRWRADLRAAGTRAGAPSEVAEGFCRDRERSNMAEAIRQVSVGARLRPARLRAGRVRRRGRPARLRGRAPARHAHAALPSARRRAVGVRHRARGRALARRARRRARARSTTRRSRRSSRLDARLAQRGARSLAAEGCRCRARDRAPRRARSALRAAPRRRSTLAESRRCRAAQRAFDARARARFGYRGPATRSRSSTVRVEAIGRTSSAARRQRACGQRPDARARSAAGPARGRSGFDGSSLERGAGVRARVPWHRAARSRARR